jgi:hypothetical protein
LIGFFVFLAVMFAVLTYGLVTNPPGSDDIKLGSWRFSTHTAKRKFGLIVSGGPLTYIHVILFGRAFIGMKRIELPNE